jgi:hypothetical protein
MRLIQVDNRSLEDIIEFKQVRAYLAARSIAYCSPQIYPGSKTRHFQKLAQDTGVAFTDMLFFDDWDLNLDEVLRPICPPSFH